MKSVDSKLFLQNLTIYFSNWCEIILSLYPLWYTLGNYKIVHSHFVILWEKKIHLKLDLLLRLEWLQDYACQLCGLWTLFGEFSFQSCYSFEWASTYTVFAGGVKAGLRFPLICAITFLKMQTSPSLVAIEPILDVWRKRRRSRLCKQSFKGNGVI